MEECPSCGANRLKKGSSYKGFRECGACGDIVCNDCGEPDENGEPFSCDICRENICMQCGGIVVQDDNLELYLCAEHNGELEEMLDKWKKSFKKVKS